MKSFLKTAVTAVALGALPTLSMAGGNLVISSNQSDAAPAAAVPTEHVDGGAEDASFNEMGSGVTVSLQVYVEAVSS